MKRKYIDNLLANQAYIQQNMNKPDPFDKGIMRAVKSARESLQMDEKQEDKALRNSILSVGEGLPDTPRRKGFLANLARVGRAIVPGIKKYDEQEKLAEQENMAMANYLQNLKLAEDAKAMHLEERAYKRDLNDRLFGLEERKLAAKNAQYGDGQGYGLQGQGLQGDMIPIRTVHERDKYLADKKGLGTTLKELNEIEKSYDDFEKATAGNAFDALSPIGRQVNAARGIVGRFSGNKDLRKEEAERKGLFGRMNKFSISNERVLKGGVLGPRIVEVFKQQGIYPDTEIDSPETIKEKLKYIRHELETNYKAANLSLQYGAHIDPSELGKFGIGENKTRIEDAQQPVSSQTPTNPEEKILMINPNTGIAYNMPISDIPAAKIAMPNLKEIEKDQKENE
jgi:hypothetical protein